MCRVFSPQIGGLPGPEPITATLDTDVDNPSRINGWKAVLLPFRAYIRILRLAWPSPFRLACAIRLPP
jgi:hypothetical protein